MFPQATILGPLFWIIMGLLYALLLLSSKYWFEDLDIKMNWWKWTALATWFILLSLTIAGGFTLLGEDEPRAAKYFLGVFGIISIISGVGLWRLLLYGKEKQN